MSESINSILSKYYGMDKGAVEVIKYAVYDYYSIGLCKNISEYEARNGDTTEDLFDLYFKIGGYVSRVEETIFSVVCREYLEDFSSNVLVAIKRKALIGNILNINSATKDEFYTFIERADSEITIREGQRLYKLYIHLYELLAQE